MSKTHATLEGVLRTEGARLHALLYRLTLSTHAADDLLQELCVRLIGSSTFAVADSPTGFAVRAAVHLGLEWRRRRRADGGEPPEYLAARGDGPEAAAMRREELEQLLEAVQQLREPLREIVVLHHIEGEPYERIAVLLGKTPQQVRGLAYKGVLAIRETLNGPSHLANGSLPNARHH